MAVVPEGKCLDCHFREKPSREVSISELKLSELTGSLDRNRTYGSKSNIVPYPIITLNQNWSYFKMLVTVSYCNKFTNEFWI